MQNYTFFLTIQKKCGYFNLVDNRDAIEYAYYETEKSLTLAELNLETAKTSPINVIAA